MTPYNKVYVNGVLIRLAIDQGRIWIRELDLSKAIKCALNTVKYHSAKLNQESRVYIDNAYFVDERGVRNILVSTHVAGARAVLSWIDDGGMRLPQEHPAYANAYADSSDGCLVNGKRYCLELLTVLLDKCDANDLMRVAHAIEGEAAFLLHKIPCRHLNDARHDLFRRFYLQGGEK
ncbi:TPA: hypothetical protein NID53_004188 [Pseudomonas aeruginosa]|uniref:hypothetical protein n=1 Tax=Pseudomonas aeruginosa TaxID=287 RepID=UPI0027442485|nr:hypothetical protein [Pseudomonas aeruginosa]HBP1440492.1 hypothetical protein [Pseudomonas aeruginosa]HCF3556212.1 hypothetical protein [Pseudomonas aeruginosa]HCF3916524.1 hypothetical protein [Pseudomonas aeruginosa]HCR1632014.1 hypothetical protein [Pseudomonas aeruginosa]